MVGGSDKKFSTAANWNDDTAPVTGDSLSIPADVVLSGCTSSNSETFDATLNNDLDSASITLAGIAITGTKPTDCYSTIKIVGNSIRTSGDINNVSNSYLPTITSSIILEGNVTIKSVQLEGAISAGAHNLTVEGISSQSGISGTGILTITSDTSGGHSGGGSCDGIGYGAPFSGDSSGFTGSIQVTNYGSLVIGANANSLGRHASAVNVNEAHKDWSSLDFYLNYEQDTTFDTPINISSGGLSASQAFGEDCKEPTENRKVTINGAVAISGDIKIYPYNVDVYFAGNVNGKEHIKVAEGVAGSVSFADGSVLESAQQIITIDSTDDCFNFQSSNKNQKTIVNADCSDKLGVGNYPILVYGILAGAGKVGNVEIQPGGRIAPGLSPGTLTVGNIAWNEGGIYEFEVGKDGADQIKAVGTVNLGNGTLSVIRYEGFVPKAKDSYVIIDNDGADAVNGTFKDLPEGATFTNSDGGVYKISYKGGDGNDVTLTVVTAPKTPNTGFEMLKNNPILTLFVTTGSAVAIAFVARKSSIRRTKA